VILDLVAVVVLRLWPRCNALEDRLTRSPNGFGTDHNRPALTVAMILLFTSFAWRTVISSQKPSLYVLALPHHAIGREHWHIRLDVIERALRLSASKFSGLEIVVLAWHPRSVENALD